ncbi:FCD domain-containing protein [Novosphingobium sp. BL-8A]|uniref:FCD domain-containing protein n=1 Tax=Novosphingobium sp. BL-8A TaxID=3127639 RepID=UPI003756D801
MTANSQPPEPDRSTTRKAGAGRKGSREGKDGLVQSTATALRDIILRHEPGAWIGALPDLAQALQVGVVTIQQAARVLEYEGFLKVRRGNGGGYYGARPDAQAISRAMSTLLIMHRTNEAEPVEITTLLDCELMAGAARCVDEGLRQKLRALAGTIDDCDCSEKRAHFEEEMQDILYAMVDRPIMELFARATMQHQTRSTQPPIYAGVEGMEEWQQQRRDLINAILRKDPELAEFEARRRRAYMLKRLRQVQ